ncbi:MAG: LPS assembly protein LptD [Pseudomonadota bacterium]
MRRIIALLFMLVAWPAAAQELPLQAATLVADSVLVTDERLLIAEGNVDILQGETRLRAQRVVYDGENDTLLIEGPLELRDGSETVILASQAELSEGLENGILRGARLVLDQQLQLAAVEIQRIDGRYSQALKVGATSCHVCDSGRPPLWQIRARRIVHDQVEQQLYFDDAQLQVLGVPVFYLPRLRLPGPTLERATGFLVPEIRSSSLLGWGIKTPYFVRIGDHADLTFTPFLATDTRTLELRYRHAFASGEIEWNTYLTRDQFSEARSRAGLLAEGRFDVFADYELRFDIEATTDSAYLSDYDYSEKDRLDSAISLTRTDRDATSTFEFIHIRSLRDDERNATLPGLIFDARRKLRFTPEIIGGDAQLSLDFHSHFRTSDDTTDTDGDGISDGLDLTRVGVALDWQREWVVGPGLILGAKAMAVGDAYAFGDQVNFDDTVARSSGGAAVSLGWPLMMRTAAGAHHVLEPKIQLAMTDVSSADIPNEDSTRVEFDEGNLFALNRAPGSDVIEDGSRLDVGVSWARSGPRGWDSTLTLGRMVRFSGTNAFTRSSGIAGDSSNWLISGTLDTQSAFGFTGRILLEQDLSVTESALRMAYDGGRFRSSTAYAYLSSDPEEDRSSPASELALDAAYDINDVVTGLFDVRYDFNANTTTEAGLGLTYSNECVEVALSVSRNFTSSGNVTPSTDFGLTVGLKGFGTTAGRPRAAPSCR